MGILNEWLNVLQSIQLPFAPLPVLHFTSEPKIMGNFVNNKFLKSIGWFLAGLVIVINFYLVTTSVLAPESPTPQTPLFLCVLCCCRNHIHGFYLFCDPFRFDSWYKSYYDLVVVSKLVYRDSRTTNRG